MRLHSPFVRLLAAVLSAQLACGMPPVFDSDRDELEAIDSPASSSTLSTASAGPTADDPLSAFSSPQTNTGAFTTKVPFPVPPGFPGLTPELALSYSSQGSDGLAGVGWDLGLPAIMLEGSNGARPPSISDDLSMHARSGEPLERYQSPHGRIAVQRSGGRLRFFMNPHDGTRVKAIADWSGSTYRSGDVAAWEITTPDGRKYRYGTTVGSSHLRSYATGGGTAPARKVVWLLERVEDTRGNVMLYHYTDRPVGGDVVQPALVGIEYGIAGTAPTSDRALVVSFQYIPRPTRRPTFAMGTRTDDGALLDKVCVHAGTRYSAVSAGSTQALERCWDLTYDFEGGPRSYTERPLLVQVQERASTGATRPPWKFNYQHQGKSWRNTYPDAVAAGTGKPWTFPWAGPTGLVGQLGYTNEALRATVTDVNGDGVPDAIHGRRDGKVDVAYGKWSLAAGAVESYEAAELPHPLASASPASLEGVARSATADTSKSDCWHSFDYDVSWSSASGLSYPEALTRQRNTEEANASQPLAGFEHLSSSFNGVPPMIGHKDVLHLADTIDEIGAYGKLAPNRVRDAFDARGSDCRDWGDKVELDYCFGARTGASGKLGSDLSCFDEAGGRWMTGRHGRDRQREGYSSELWKLTDLDGDGLVDWVFAAPMIAAGSDGALRDGAKDRDWYWARGNGTATGWDAPQRWRVPRPDLAIAGTTAEMVHGLGMLGLSTQETWNEDKAPGALAVTLNPLSPWSPSVRVGPISANIGMARPHQKIDPISGVGQILSWWAAANGTQLPTEIQGAFTVVSMVRIGLLISGGGVGAALAIASLVVPEVEVSTTGIKLKWFVSDIAEAFDTDIGETESLTPQGLVDLTGDGRPDLVTTTYDTGSGVNAATEWLLYRNLGDGGFADPVLFRVDVPTGTFGTATLDRSTGKQYREGFGGSARTFGQTVTRQTLADLNGDGLDDLIEVPAHFGSAGPVWNVALNHGEGFARPMEWKFTGSTSRTAGPFPGGLAYGDGPGSYKLSRAIEQLADVNGDGRLDFVEVDTCTSGGCDGYPSEGDFASDSELWSRVSAENPDAHLFVRLNLGDRFGERIEWGNNVYPLSGERHWTAAQQEKLVSTGDFDADGGLDLAVHTGALDENKWTLYPLREKNADALARLQTPEYGVVYVEYRHLHESTGAMANGVWVVDNLHVKDHEDPAVTSLDVRHRFEYEGGRTDRTKRRSLGFERIYQYRDDTTRTTGGYTLSRYYQDAGLVGLPYCREVRRTDLAAALVLPAAIDADRAAWAAAPAGSLRAGYQPAVAVGAALSVSRTAFPSSSTNPAVLETSSGATADALLHSGVGPGVAADDPAIEASEASMYADESLWGARPEDDNGTAAPVTSWGGLPTVVGTAPASITTNPTATDWVGGGLKVTTTCTPGSTVVDGRVAVSCTPEGLPTDLLCGDLDDPGKIITADFTIHANASGEAGLDVPQLRRTQNRLYDANGANPRTSLSDMSYDRYGNLVKVVEAGDIAIAGDERTVVRTMTAPNLTRFIVNRECSSEALDATGARTHRIRTGYDGGAVGGCVMPTDGLATSVATDIDASSSITSTTSYTADGQPLAVTTPRTSTTTTYDGSYKWIAVENRATVGGVVHRTQTGYAGVNLPRSAGGFGVAIKWTDANGAIASDTLDVFGRTLTRTPTGATSPNELHAYVDATSLAAARHEVRYKRGTGEALELTTTTAFGGSASTKVTPPTNDAGCVAGSCYLVSSHDRRGDDGLIDRAILPYFGTSGATEPTITTKHDPVGRVTRVTTPDGSVVRTYYDREQKTTIDPLGRRTTIATDTRGATTESTDYAGTSVYRTTRFTRRADGQPSEVTDNAGNRWTYRYDYLGRVVQTTDPDAGMTLVHRYDGVGTTIVKGARFSTSGAVTASVTDGLGRNVRETEYVGATVTGPTVTGTIVAETTTTYDVDARSLVGASLTCAVNKPIGHPSRIERRELRGSSLVVVSRKDHCYNARGQLTDRVHTIDGVPYRSSFTYDEQGDVVTTTLPTGRALRNNRDVTGHIVSSMLDARALVTMATADAGGRPTRIALGNGLTTRSCYDSLGRTRRGVTGGASVGLTCGTDLSTDVVTGTPLWSATYERSADGRLSSRELSYRDPMTSTTVASATSYTHDAVGRIESETNGSAGTTTFSYDTIDNLLGSGATTYAVGGTGPHRLTSGGGYALSYNVDGTASRISTPAHSYDLTWSPAGRVTRIVRDGSAAYELSYDETGTRVEQRAPSGATRYAGPVRVTPTETVTTLGWGAMEVTRGAASDLYWSLGDQVGSLSVLTDSAGRIVQAAEHDAFGTSRAAATFDPVPSDGITPYASTSLLTGKELDSAFAPEDQIFDFGARIYVAPIGRWLSPDPKFDDGLNRYAYVRNDPLNLVDPDGRAGETPKPIVLWTNDDDSVAVSIPYPVLADESMRPMLTVIAQRRYRAWMYGPREMPEVSYPSRNRLWSLGRFLAPSNWTRGYTVGGGSTGSVGVKGEVPEASVGTSQSIAGSSTMTNDVHGGVVDMQRSTRDEFRAMLISELEVITSIRLEQIRLMQMQEHTIQPAEKFVVPTEEP